MKEEIKFRLLSIFIAIVFLLNTNLTSGLGVSPGRVEADFVPEADFTLDTCFSQYTTRYLLVEPMGFVADSIEIISGVGEDWIMDTQTNGGCMKYKVTLPKNFEKPGLQYGGISATEIPEDSSGNIYAVVKIIQQIYIKVPYPGKYLEVSMTAHNTPAGENVPITIMLESKGVETINSASGKIEIHDSDGNILEAITIPNNALIKTNERRQVDVKWNSSPNKEGIYKAKARVDYDGLNNNATSNFKLGGLDLNLIDYTKQIIIGGLTKFTVDVDSIWSETIPDAKATVYVFRNGSNEIVQEFETLTRPVVPWGKASLQGYIDPQQLGLGEHKIQINLTFSELIKPYDGEIRIVEPPKTEEPKKSINFVSTPILLTIIAVLVIAIILIALFALRKRDEKKPEESDPKNKSTQQNQQ